MNINQRKNSIFLITNIPTPYRIPLFNELYKQLESKGLRLKVVFGALGYGRRKWAIDMSECQFEWEVLPSKSIPYADPEKSSFTYSSLCRIVSKEKPSLIITNAFSLATTKLWFRSWFKNTPYLIWSGAIQRKNEPVSFLRKLQRRILIRKARAFIAYGIKAKEYLINLGADAKKIQIGINTVDTEFYRSKTLRVRNNATSDADNIKHLLYVGHLTQGKRLDQLFEAIYVLAQHRDDFILNIVGEGAEINNLEILAKKLDIIDFISFKGFKQKEDIPTYLAQADCFLFPSEYDVWGLVLIEAMSAGLPCIASIYAGATHGLIKNGKTGFAMDFAETEKVAEKINWILDNQELSKKIGENASRFIAEHVNIKNSAAGFVRAITKALE